MTGFLSEFLSSKFFMPHGHCYLWKPALVWLQVVTNSSIGLAYLAITATLVILVRRVRNIPFQWMYLAFGAFIVACGITHFFDVVVIWSPVYWLDGAVRAVTAVASVGTALLLPSLLPKVKLLADSAALAHERGVRLQTLNAELNEARDELEERVRQRTAELVRTTAELTSEIAERRRVEEALREGEQGLVTTLNSIAEGVIATDVEGAVVRMNPVAEDLTGWHFDQARGRHFGEIFSASTELDLRPVLKEAMAGPVADRLVLVTPDGRKRPIARLAAPIRDGQGKVTGVVLVFRDQSEERRMEEMRLKSLELQTQNERIQEASRLKSEFLANMSHELRTPLNSIIGFSELLSSGQVRPEMPEHEQFTKEILASGRHLLRLINEVLDLSKVESGTLRFFPEPVDVPAMIAEVVGIMRATMSSKRVAVTFQVDPGVIDVVLDPSRFKQVLYNFLSNALKFTGPGGRVQIHVSLEDASDRLRLEVTDTGIGIAASDLERLFVEFQQLDAGAAKRHAGTGLGLALTKRLVEAQGGGVGVRSTLGEGSTFFALLPRRTPPTLAT